MSKSKYKIGDKVFVQQQDILVGPYTIVGYSNSAAYSNSTSVYYLILHRRGFSINDNFLKKYNIPNPTLDGIDLLKETGRWVRNDEISGLVTKCSCKKYE